MTHEAKVFRQFEVRALIADLLDISGDSALAVVAAMQKA